MASDGMIGNGTKVAYAASSPPTWKLVGQLLDVEGFEFSRNKVDRTVHSTNMYKRNLPGMAEVSDMALKILADPDETGSYGQIQQELRNYCKAGTNLYWRIEIPCQRDLTVDKYLPYEFKGWVGRFKHATPIEEGQVFEVDAVYDAASFDVLASGASAIT